MRRKSIVLSDTQGPSSKKAVLTLQENGNSIEGSLRLYNFPQEPLGVLSLGLYSGKKVQKAGLTRKGQMFYQFFLNIDKIPDKFSCAIVNFQNAQPSPMLFGSSEGSPDDVYANIITQVAGETSYEKTKQVLDEFGVDFDDAEKAEIEKEIDKNLCEEHCENCIYKKFFYENADAATIRSNSGSCASKPCQSQPCQSASNHASPSQAAPSYSTPGESTSNFSAAYLSEDEAACQSLKENARSQHVPSNDVNASGVANASQVEEAQPASEEPNVIFFDRLKPQIDKLFENNPTENSLQNIFPSSKWVKVEYEDEGDFFVFGLLYDDDGNVKYVCYGVPSVFEEGPPEELSGYPIWLPLADEKGFGYWMTYQDAVTGEPIKAILD